MSGRSCLECGRPFRFTRGGRRDVCSRTCWAARLRRRRPDDHNVSELARQQAAAADPDVVRLRALQGDHWGGIDPSPALAAYCTAVLLAVIDGGELDRARAGAGNRGELTTPDVHPARSVVGRPVPEAAPRPYDRPGTPEACPWPAVDLRP